MALTLVLSLEKQVNINDVQSHKSTSLNGKTKDWSNQFEPNVN